MSLTFPNIYTTDKYKYYIVLPIVLVLVAMVFIPQIKYGVEFKGGSLVTLTLNNSNVDTANLQSVFENAGYSEVGIKFFKTTFGGRVEIEIPHTEKLSRADKIKESFVSLLNKAEQLEFETINDKAKVDEAKKSKAELVKLAKELFSIDSDTPSSNINELSLKDLNGVMNEEYNKIYNKYTADITDMISKNVKYSSISIRTVTPVLSERFLSTVFQVMIYSVLVSIILVFFFFRDLVPALAVLTGAFSDITISAGGMGLLGIPLTMPSFAALLMLIGFSLDTDILLTMRILKREGNARKHAYESMKTGLTMSISAIIAFLVLFGLGFLTRIPTYYQISVVALMGLVGDMIATWFLNAVIVLWHKEHPGRRRS